MPPPEMIQETARVVDAVISGGAAVARVRDLFTLSGLSSPEIEADLLVRHVLGVSRAEFAASDIPVNRRSRDEIERLAKRRADSEPLQYVLGEVGFRSLLLRIDDRALIPRPETEVLAGLAIDTARIVKDRRGSGHGAPVVVDLCTGSGAIALACAAEVGGIDIYATDICKSALSLAEENANLFGFDFISFCHGDLFAALPANLVRGCDILVANPPYVPESEWGALPAEIRDHEPRIALVGGGDGMYFVEKIISGSPRWLKPGGHLFVEVGDGQAPAAARLFESSGFDGVEILADLTGRERVVSGCLGS